MLNKGVPEEKITVVSNWIDIDEIYPVKKRTIDYMKSFQYLGINFWWFMREILELRKEQT